MAEVKNIDLSEKEKDKESTPQSDNSGLFAMFSLLLSFYKKQKGKRTIGNI